MSEEKGKNGGTTASASSIYHHSGIARIWSDGNFQEMAQLWKLSDEEQTNMRELQRLLADINHWKNDPFEVVRYLREYRSVQKAAHMFRRMVEWRISHQIDTFLDTYGEPPRLFHYLPTFLCQGLDRDGDPIYVERTGSSDPYGLVLAYGGVEPLAQYTAFIREMTTTRRRTPTGRYCWQRDYYEPLMKRRMTKFTVIMDMQGLSARHLRGGLLGLLKRMARISQDFYAGMAKRVIILRAPAIFEFGWNHIVQHFFDHHIRELIVFSNAENFMEVLDTYIDLTVLPPCLAPGHGRGKAMPQYFTKIHLQGGFIPKDCDYVAAEQQMDTTTPGSGIQERPGETKSTRTINGSIERPMDRRVSGSSLLRGQWDPIESQFHTSTVRGTQVRIFPMQN